MITKKHLLSLLLVLLVGTTFLCLEASAQTSGTNRTVIENGVGLGAVIAVVASWSRNESILWAILHGLFGWLYVVYFAITRDNTNR